MSSSFLTGLVFVCFSSLVAHSLCAPLLQRNGKIQLRYKEMSATFVQVLEKEAEKSVERLPTDLGVNLFGSIIDEFVKRQ